MRPTTSTPGYFAALVRLPPPRLEALSLALPLRAVVPEITPRRPVKQHRLPAP
jgi:hypothetical protein